MGKLLRMDPLPRADLPAGASIAEEEEQGIQLQHRIARNLSDYRSMRGLTVESLAQQSNVDSGALRAAESCAAMPSLGLLWKVARVLGVSCLALTGEEPEEPIDVSHRPDAEASLSARRL